MRRKSSAAFACMRAGISSENSSRRRSGILTALSTRRTTLPFRGRVACPGQAGGGGHKHGGNGFEHCLSLRHDIVVPKSQNAIAFRVQPTRSSFIAPDICIDTVLRAVDLDDE